MKQKILSPKAFLSLAFAAASIFANAQSWSLTGNSGTSATKNFLGTIDNKNLIFRTDNIERMRIGIAGNVGIGTTSPAGKLGIEGGTAVSLTAGGYAVLGSATSANLAMDFNQIQARSNGTYNSLYLNNSGGSVYAGNSSTSPYGVVGYGENEGVYGVSYTGTGTYGYASGGTGSDPSAASGVYGYNASTGYGVGGYCTSGSGVYGYSLNYDGVFGAIGNSTYYAGYFAGNIYCSGTYLGSDRKLKQNIADFSNAMNIINELHPRQYQYRQDGNYKLMNLPQGQHYGLIAQDVEQILPNLVKDSHFDTKMAQAPKPIDPKNPTAATTAAATASEVIDYKAVNYTELIPIMIKAMQEQQAQINALTQQVATLSAEKTTSASAPVSVSSAVLNQNAPNPFKGSTQISYSLPASFSSAMIIIRDNSGSTLKTIPVSGNGKGTMTLDASSLSAGTYSYSLMVDGQVTSTKQMILTR